VEKNNSSKKQTTCRVKTNQKYAVSYQVNYSQTSLCRFLEKDLKFIWTLGVESMKNDALPFESPFALMRAYC